MVPYKMNDQVLSEGIFHCLNKSKQLVNDAKILLDTDESSMISLGLFTYALEEFGKAVWLKDIKKKKLAIYEIPKEVFRNHDEKISRALKELPGDISVFSPGTRVSIPSLNNETKRLGKNGAQVTITGSGTFFDTSGFYSMGFDVRTDSFFVDWDNQRKQWKYNLEIHQDELRSKIVILEQHLDSFKIDSS